MPVEIGLWRIDGPLRRLSPSPMASESELEGILAADPTSLLGLDVLVIARQVRTAFGKRIDLVGIDAEGDVHLVELKRDRTPREVVAQVLDYATWLKDLTYLDLKALYESQGRTDQREFEEAFADRFGEAPPESVNAQQRLLIIASELDPSTERIVTYLATDYGLPLNTLFFRHYEDDGHRYLARTWLLDPGEVESKAGRQDATKEPWNGRDFYVAFGENDNRSWTDASRFGFVSAGQGTKYKRAMQRLPVGARVFVHIPSTGYVGVGISEDPAVPIRDFKAQIGNSLLPILEADLEAPMMDQNAGDPERTEYVVRVRWLKSLSRAEAIWEAGMFANQNVVAKLRSRFTLDRLIDRFELGESAD